MKPSASPTSTARSLRFLACAVLIAGVSTALPSCGGEETYTITDVRHVPAPEPAPERMPAGHPPIGARTDAGPEAGPSRFTWTTPEGWEEQEARLPRVARFVPGGSTKTTCVVFVMGTMAGDLSTHVNRWRSDFGQPPLDDGAIQALRRIDALGRKGALVRIEGQRDEDDPGALLGFVVEDDEQVILVKMTGPAGEVLGEAERFEAFCGSLGQGE